MQAMDRVLGILDYRRRFAPAFDDACGPLEQRPFPLMEHRRADPIFGGQSADPVFAMEETTS